MRPTCTMSTLNSERYTTPFGFSSLFAFCGLPLRLDSYKGCGFRCSYCFARAREGVSGSPQIKPADPELLSRYLKRVFVDKSENLSVVSKCLLRRMPVHFGVMGDPFQPVERRHRISLHYLRALLEYQYPVVISTRGYMIAESPYIDILRSHPAVVVRMSLSTTEDNRSLMTERREVAPSRILKAMEKLRSVGVRVTCRWQPYIQSISEDPRLFAERVAAAGCEQCSFEFLRLPRERNQQLVKSIGSSEENIFDYYSRNNAFHRVREYILPPEHRLPLILYARQMIRAAGMRFASADNDFQFLSDDACCCSGVDAYPGFENFFRHQIAFAVRNSLGKKIKYKSIATEWYPAGSVDRYLNSSRGKRGSVRDHIMHRWNSSGLEGSPDSFYGVEDTGEHSADGMKIYRWDQTILSKIRAAE